MHDTAYCIPVTAYDNPATAYVIIPQEQSWRGLQRSGDLLWILKGSL